MQERNLSHVVFIGCNYQSFAQVILRGAKLSPDILIKTNEYLVSYRCLAVEVNKSGVSVCVC
jgi:hypothetical protein